MESERVLVVDDEASIRHVVGGVLESEGCEVQVAASAEEALALLSSHPPAVAVVDIVLPGMDGMALLERIKQTSPDTEVVIMTSHASVATAIRAIREGAYDYLEKPFDDIEEVWIVVERALDKRRLAVNNRNLLEEQSRRNRELSATVARLSSLIDAGRAMGSFTTLPELLDVFVGLVSLELEVDRASLMLLDPPSRTLRIAASRGLDNIDPASVCVPVGEGVAGSVAKSGEPMLVLDVKSMPKSWKLESPSLSDSFMSAPIVMSMPILARKRVLGVINVTNRRCGRPFDDEDLAYLEGLAGQLGVAIERARHFDSLMTAQQKLVAAERMKVLGQMAAGVAHDFNNALSVVLTRAEFALGRLEAEPIDVPKIRRDLESIRKIALQGADTIKRIQDYTRIRKDQPDAVVDLNLVVREALEMTRPKWKGESEANGRAVEIRVELGEIPSVSGNFHELIQVVDNLIFNAVEAMPAGGTLSFRTSADGDRVRLEVGDTGSGMDEQTCRRLFEPFFTTKESGQGLGTSIVLGIVTRHRGEVGVESAPGRGTTFRIWLPQTEQPGTAVCIESRAPQSGPTLKILVVDDDDDVRDTYQEALTSNGHEVVALPNGDEALQALGQQRFDLLITDLSMAGMSGLDVARRAKQIDPTVPVALLSGWAVQQDEEKVKQAGVDHVLAKPCTIRALLELVQGAVRSRVQA